MTDTSKKLRVLYLSEGTSCPEQEWSDEPRSYGDEPYTPYVPYSAYQSLVEQCEKLAEAFERIRQYEQALEEFRKFKEEL